MMKFETHTSEASDAIAVRRASTDTFNVRHRTERAGRLA